MSIEAMIWVRKHAPTKNSAEMCILYALADRANDDGTGCWPYYETLADEARVSLPTVKRHIKNLEERGLIVRGNQALVASYPKYRKPVVWNLNMKLRREVKKPEEKAGDHIDTTQECGINGDKVRYQNEQTEVSVSTDCGVTGDTDNPPITSLEPSVNPPTPAGVSDTDVSGHPQPNQQSSSDDRGKGRHKDFQAFLDAYGTIAALDNQMIGEAARVWHSMFKAGSLPPQDELMEGLRVYWRAMTHNERVTGRSVRKRPGNWLRDHMWAADEENLKFEDSSQKSGAKANTMENWLGLPEGALSEGFGFDQAAIVDGTVVEQKELTQ